MRLATDATTAIPAKIHTDIGELKTTATTKAPMPSAAIEAKTRPRTVSWSHVMMPIGNVLGCTRPCTVPS